MRHRPIFPPFSESFETQRERDTEKNVRLINIYKREKKWRDAEKDLKKTFKGKSSGRKSGEIRKIPHRSKNRRSKKRLRWKSRTGTRNRCWCWWVVKWARTAESNRSFDTFSNFQVWRRKHKRENPRTWGPGDLTTGREPGGGISNYEQVGVPLPC